LIKDGKRTSGGIFTVRANGYGSLLIKAGNSLLGYTAFGITIEPAGGSPEPTGAKVLGGNL
jgi:anti-sigma-K factor RskA